MQSDTIKRNSSNKVKKTIGRGGTRGKTSGHGHKGQKQHGRHGIRPEMRDLIKKIPKLRGRGKNSNKSIQTKPFIVNIATIDELFKTGETVSPTTLQEKGILKGNQMPRGGVKVLGMGETKKKFTISACVVSESAREKIEKAGGIIE